MSDSQSGKIFESQDLQEDFLPVIIGGEVVLIKSTEVKEVIRPLPLTTVPMGPNHLLGLANICGQIVCIIDLSKISAMPAINRDVTARSRFIVLRHPSINLGIWADEVRPTQYIDSQACILPENSELLSNPVSAIENLGQTQYMLNCMKLFH